MMAEETSTEPLQVVPAAKKRKSAPDVAAPHHRGSSRTAVQKPKSSRKGKSECSPTGHEPTRLRLSPFLVSIDWLTVNMVAPCGNRGQRSPLPWDAMDPASWWDETNTVLYYTDPTPNRTRRFNRITYVRDPDGKKVATISHDPFQQGLYGPGWIQVQFENEELYTGRWSTIYAMFRAMGCEYRSCNQVDIACDGVEGHGGEWPAVMEQERTGRAKYYGKCDWISRKSRSRTIGGEFGTRGSNKFIRAYNKTREMKTKGKVLKQYIIDAWEGALGFDPYVAGVTINRFEAKLKGTEIRRYFADERSETFLLNLADPAKRVELFAAMAPGMFDFRTLASRARDAVSLCQWDWSGVVESTPDPVPRATRNLAITDHTIKTGIRAMVLIAMGAGDTYGIELAEHYAVSAGPHIERWYIRKLHEWTRDFAAVADAKDPRSRELFFAFRNPEPPNEARLNWPDITPANTFADTFAIADANVEITGNDGAN